MKIFCQTFYRPQCFSHKNKGNSVKIIVMVYECCRHFSKMAWNVIVCQGKTSARFFYLQCFTLTKYLIIHFITVLVANIGKDKKDPVLGMLIQCNTCQIYDLCLCHRSWESSKDFYSSFKWFLLLTSCWDRFETDIYQCNPMSIFIYNYNKVDKNQCCIKLCHSILNKGQAR